MKSNVKKGLGSRKKENDYDLYILEKERIKKDKNVNTKMNDVNPRKAEQTRKENSEMNDMFLVKKGDFRKMMYHACEFKPDRQE